METRTVGWKRFSGLVLVLGCVLMLVTGCGERSDKTADGRTRLVFWHTYNDKEEAILKEVIADWEKANPEWKIRAVTIPFQGHQAKLRTSLTVGRGPDMARVDWSFVCELARKNAVASLESFGFDKIKDDYLPAPRDTNFIDGSFYGLPDQTTGLAMFYNKAMFRVAGLDPEMPPKTWDEFIEQGKKLSNPASSTYAFGMENTLWWSLPFFNVYGAKIVSPDGKTCLLDSPEAIAAMELKADLFLKHKIEAGAWRAGSITPEQGFINGRYAMIFMGPWNLAKFVDSKLDFGVGLIPAGPKGTSTNVGGTNVVIFKHGKHQVACYKFLTYFTSPEVQAKWCKTLNQIPVNVRAYDLVKFEDKNLSSFMEQMKHAVSNPIVTNYSDLEDIINPEMETVLTGQKTAAEALRNAARRIEEKVLSRR
jgi:ABC-type glycerol-3-phosphate transport system substrate-binding protein